jgi:hypothetical protein
MMRSASSFRQKATPDLTDSWRRLGGPPGLLSRKMVRGGEPPGAAPVPPGATRDARAREPELERDAQDGRHPARIESARPQVFAARLPTKRRASRLLTEHDRKEYVDPRKG